MNDIIKATSNEVSLAIGKGLLGALPIVGSLASELLGLLVSTPIEKRRVEWMTSVGNKLKELEEANRIIYENLSNDPQFIDTVLQATTFALKTSDQVKIEAFRNAIINTALGESPDAVLSQMFINQIDSFTTWHIQILHLFNNPTEWFNKNNKPLPEYTLGSLMNIIISAYPELNGHDELLNLIWADLKRAGFHNTADLGTSMSGNGLLAVRITEIGRKFLTYIS